MYYYSLIFEDGYLVDGKFNSMNELKELIIDTIEDSENENELFSLMITRLCQ